MIDYNETPSGSNTPHPLQRVRRLVSIDTSPYTAEVCRRLFGTPNQTLSSNTQWRFGTKGSLAIEVADSPGKQLGEWYDHEQGFGGRDPQSLLIEHEGMTPESARDYLVSCGVRIDDPKGKKVKKSIVSEFNYLDESGNLLYQVVRFEPKGFSQRKKEKDGSWYWNVKGVRHVPYNLPDIIKSTGRIYVVEGEKLADRLKSLNFTATTNSGGAGKWLSSYDRYFVGRDVVLLPDNDPQATMKDGTLRFYPDGRPIFVGQDHMAEVAKHLRSVAHSCTVLQLPGLPPKGDVVNWLDAGGTAEDLERFAEGAAIPEATAVANGHDILPPEALNPLETDGSTPVVVPDWIGRLQLFETGEPRPILDNVCLAIEFDARLRHLLAFDEFAQRVVITRPPPWVKANGHWDERQWSDGDSTSLCRFLQRHGLICATGLVYEAVTNVAFNNKFHPVRDYLERLAWDGKSRIDKWLTYYLGAEVTEFNGAIGVYWLISAVARIFDPGCQVDCALFLVGDQGGGKSTTFKILGGEWFSDDIGELGSKDSQMQMLGKWIFELADLEQFARSDIRRIKAFMSRRIDHFRPPYGRAPVDNKRQCIFGGTTNEDEFLRDPTGDRRFWPVRVATVDLNSLSHDRDQIWAEATTRYRAGEKWHLRDDGLIAKAKVVQEEHYQRDAWDDILDKYFNRKVVPITNITVSDLLADAIELPKDKWSRLEQMRVASYLKKNGWRRRHDRAVGWRYVLGDQN